MTRFKDMTNLRFGRLTVLECVGRDNNGNALWRCKCDCGKENIVDGCRLRKGNTKSCGCYNIYRTKICNSTHRKSKTRLYAIWGGIKARCSNPKCEAFKKYGGRGIKFCKDWVFYENFEKWALNNGYSSNLTIDRIDNDGNYEPSNCRWISSKEQSLNTSRNHYLELNGEKHTAYEWSVITGIRLSTILQRINKYHWTIQRALTEKPFKGKNQYYDKEVKHNE